MKIGKWQVALRRPRPRPGSDPVVLRLHPDGTLTKASIGDIQAARVTNEIQADSDWAKKVYGEQIAKSSLVYRAVTARAHAVRSAPIKVMRRLKDGSSDPVDKTHPVQELFDRVNPWWTSADLLAATETYLSLWGSAYWFIDKDSNTLWPLRPDRVRIVPGKPEAGQPFDPASYIKGYWYEPEGGAGTKIPLLTDEVIWFRYFNPLDEYAGLSPVAPTRLAQDMTSNAIRFNADFFKNGAMPQDLIFMAEGPLSDEDVQEFYQRLEDRLKGEGKQHRPMIWDMTKGAGPKMLGLSQRDMEFMGTLEYGLQDAARVWGVPPPLLMSEKQTTYNNVREARILFYVETISEEWDFLEMEINELMLPLLTTEADLFVQFDRSRIRPLQEAMAEQQAASLLEISVGVLTINEFRTMYGREPVDWGDVWWPSNTVTPIDSSEGPPQAPPGQQSQPALRAARNGRFTDEDVSSHLKAFEQRLTATESRIADFQKRIFRRQEVSALRELRKMGDRAMIAEVLKQGGEPIFNPAEWAPTYRGEGARLLTQILVLAGQTQAGLFDLGPFDAGDIGIAEWTSDRAAFWGQRVDAETAALITEEIEAGLLAEESIRQLEVRVRKVFGQIADFRAERIARTEAIGASNQGHLTLYDQSPVVAKKQWLTAIDGRERPAHRQAHRQTVDKDASFLVGGESLRAPGVGGSAGNVINCLLPDNRVLASGILAASSAHYTGPALEISTEGGNTLTITPNHPILTDRGWAAAKAVSPGTYLVSTPGIVERVLPASENMNHGPPKIEEIFRALDIAAFTRNSHARNELDFHGDGRFVDADINVITTNGQLGCTCQVALGQAVHQHDFASTDVLAGSLASIGALLKFFDTSNLSPDGLMGIGRKAQSFIGAGASHPREHSLAAVPRLNPGFQQMAPDDITVGQPGFREGVLGLSQLVSLDKVAEVRQFDFTGHVFDLQTVDSLYISNGLVCSNCRCTVRPILVDTSQRALSNGHSNGLEDTIAKTRRIIDELGDTEPLGIPYGAKDTARPTSRTLDIQNDEDGNPVHVEEHLRYDS